MEVKIIIKTNITYANGDKELINNQYNGNFYIQNNNYYLRYKENLNQEQGNISTVIRWSNVEIPYKIILIRQGDIKMKQIFQEGYKHASEYIASFGTVNLETTTNHIRIGKNQYGGKISLDYNLELNNQINGNYILEIDYFNQ